MTFDEAFDALIDHEKGFQNARKDRGNWTTGVIGKGRLKGTKYGVSAMSYPNEDIENLTLDHAKAIYLRDFWTPAGCDRVPDVLRFVLFDCAVHTSAPGRPIVAIEMLQRAAGVKDDGKFGKLTLAAVQGMDQWRLFARFCGQRLDQLNNNPDQWTNFGRGWAQRIAENLMRA